METSVHRDWRITITRENGDDWADARNWAGHAFRTDEILVHVIQRRWEDAPDIFSVELSGPRILTAGRISDSSRAMDRFLTGTPGWDGLPGWAKALAADALTSILAAA